MQTLLTVSATQQFLLCKVHLTHANIIFQFILQDDGMRHSNSIATFNSLMKKAQKYQFPPKKKKIHKLVGNTELEHRAFMLLSSSYITTPWEWNYLKVLWLWNPWRTARHTVLLFKKKGWVSDWGFTVSHQTSHRRTVASSSLFSTGCCLLGAAPRV